MSPEVKKDVLDMSDSKEKQINASETNNDIRIGDPLFKEWIIAIKVMKYSRDITRSNFYQVLCMDFIRSIDVFCLQMPMVFRKNKS